MNKQPFTYICITSLILFIIISVAVLNGSLNYLNENAYTYISLQANQALTNIMILVSRTGDWFVYTVIILLLLIIPKTRCSFGLPVMTTMLASVVLNNTLKQLFAIPRPDVHRLITVSGYGHPSGHVMNATAFAGICLLLLIIYAHKNFHKISALVVSAIFVVAMGFSRIYLGVHTLTDVIAGYFAGVFVVTLSFLLAKINKFF